MAPPDPTVPFRVRPRERHTRTLPAFDVKKILEGVAAPPPRATEPTPAAASTSTGAPSEVSGAPSDPAPSDVALRPASSLPPPQPDLHEAAALEAILPVGGIVGGRFHLEECLTETSSLEVWSAFDAFVGREVLLELVADDDASDDARWAQFEGLHSDHVVVPCGSGVTAGPGGAGPGGAGPGTRRFVAVPRMHGETLAQRLAREGRLTPQESARILAGAVEGLAALHDRGLVHGAIDASSIFLVRPEDRAERARPVLLAPGLARLLSDGDVVAAPSLRSPEQLRVGGDVDARTDLFALAAVLYQALTGRSPFVGKNAADVKQRVLTSTFEAPSTLRRSLPPPLDSFFRRAFAVEPQRRFASARELGAVFRMVVDDDTRAGVSDPPPPPSQAVVLRSRVGRGLRFAAVAAVLATLAVIAFWQLLDGPADASPPTAITTTR